MALLKWYEEEDNQEEDSLNSRPITKIASVQDSWQPTTQGGNDSTGGAQQPQQDNYLMSDQKAQADFQLQQRREAEAAAKAEAARQAAIARENDARARAAAEAAQQAQAQQAEYKPKDAGEAAGDFFQGLAKGFWKGGAGAVGSLASTVSSIFTGDADNDVTNATKQWQKSADDWGNSVHANGVGDFIGSLPGGIVSGIVDPANYMVRGVRNTPEMLAASIAAGSGDKNLRQAGIDTQKELQARLFGDDVATNGDGAMLMEGVAKPGAMILNVLTAGGASVPVQVSKSAYRQVAETAAKEGIINVAGGVPISVLEQAARGQEITPESVAKDALLQGVTGAAIGGLSKGYAISKNRGGVRENVNMLEQELTPVERAVEEIDSRPAEIEDRNVSFEQPNTTPVDDGFVRAVRPGEPQYTPVADNLTPVVDDGVAIPEPLTEAPDQTNGQTPPDWDEATAKEVAAVREQPTVEQPAPVADGVAQPPTIVRPVENMPTIKSEEARALQEARAGSSQAEESVINQRLKELRDETPNRRAHRVDVEGGSPNLESLDRWGSERGTGGHGTGLYFNQAEQPLYTNRGADQKPVRTQFTDTMEKPFSVDNIDQSVALNRFSQYLMASVKSGELRPELIEYARQARIPFDEATITQIVQAKNAELAGRSPGMSDKSLAEVDQPLNDYMKSLGYDGVRNNADDTARGGSVIFRGTPAYERAMQEYQSARTPRTDTPTIRDEAPTRQVDDAKYSLNNNYDDAPATIKELNRRSRQLHGDRNVSLNSNLTDGKGNDAYGMYTYADDMIKIAEGRGINTMNHESVHRAFRKHLTPDERTSILNEIKKTYRESELRGEYESQGYYKRTTNELAEEQLANNFIKYAEERANGKDITIAGKTINIPRKVVVLFERVYVKIKETFGNPDYVQQFYARLESGKYRGKGQLLPAGKAFTEPAYMVVGKNAKTFDPTDKAGRNFTGIDGMTRFEIDDSAAKLSDKFISMVKAIQKSGRGGGEPVRLGDVIDHSPLFDAYPDMADIKVSVFHEAPANGRIRYGGYTPSTDALKLNVHPRTASELRATILHEIQHAIQEREGFTGGLTKQQQRALGRGQPAGEKYYRSADEIESRLVESRRNMSQSERDATSFYDSLPSDKPIGTTIIGNKEYGTLTPVHSSTRISEEMKAAGKKPKPNKNIIPEPFENNLPDGMKPNAPVRAAQPVPRKPRGTVTPEQKSISEWAKRVYSQTDLHKDMKRRLAAALGKGEDAELELSELFSGTKVSAKDKAAITERYNKLESLSKEFNKLMQGNRKLFKDDTPESIRQGISQLDEATSRKANTLIDAYGRAERDLNGYIRKVQGQRSLAHRGVNALQNITGARNASLLSSVGGIERNITQELGANILDAVMHPVKYVRGMPQLVPEVMRSYKRAFREYKVKPKTLSEVLPYTIGNTYRVLMSPVTGQANYRKSIMRETLAESLLRAEGLNPTRAEIKKFAGSMGADSEVVANNLAGIMNGMTSHTNGLKVMQNYQDFIHTGSAKAKEAFMQNAERSSNLAAKLSRVGAESDNPKVRAAASLMNIVMPFVTTASNMAKTAATYNLNPMARSIPDEVMKAVRSNPANALALLKANAVKGGVLAGVYGLYAAGVVQYNNGDEVDKPKGISIDLGNGQYFPVRGTPIEVPIAAVVTAAMLADDVADGKTKHWSYYGGILGNSLPYIDSTSNIAAATVSALDSAFSGNADQGTGDNGYAAKSYAVNMAKSFVPYSNNGVQAGINGWQGKSTNAKSTYDKDTGKWFANSVRQAYDPAFRDSLKDSRDASGRVRTVDQQGGFRIQKGINDELTKVHNNTIDNLVKYGRENGLGRNTQDIFNTYDKGKNNNFKGIQDAITFLDVEAGADGKKSPKSEDKLKDNEKLADLAAQIRDGFYGDTGDNLLMLGDEQLYSDVSVPNKNGTKNSRLPISMQSIKNAIAATDLPEEQRNRMYEISQANQALYDRRKAGEISYDEEQAMKAQNEQEYVSILSNSENYKKLGDLMNKLDEEGFFGVGGLGSTKSGQTYLWNSLNTLLGSKGATPAAQWDSGKGFTPYGGGGRGGGRGSGFGATVKPGDYKNAGIKWAPVGKRQMAAVKTGKYTPLDIKVKLGNAVKKNRTQNYSDRSF